MAGTVRESAGVLGPFFFPYGLPGFPQPRNFALEGDMREIHLLRALAGDLTLPVVDPTLLVPAYRSLLPEDIRSEELLLRTVVVPEKGAPRTNLMAPILLDPRRGIGMQVILPDHSPRHVPVGVA